MLDDFDDDTFRFRLDEDRDNDRDDDDDPSDDWEDDDDWDDNDDDWDDRDHDDGHDYDERDDDRDDRDDDLDGDDGLSDDRHDDDDDYDYDYDYDDRDDDDDDDDDERDDDGDYDERDDDGDYDDRDDDDDYDDRDDDARFEYVVTVAYLYEATLDRDGEINLVGFNFWAARLDAGASIHDIAERFLFSDEFARKFGDPDDLDDRELVETCFRNILDRDGAEAGIAHWTGALADPGFDRVDLVLAFTRSAENMGDPGYETRLTEAEDGSWVFG